MVAGEQYESIDEYKRLNARLQESSVGFMFKFTRKDFLSRWTTVFKEHMVSYQYSILTVMSSLFSLCYLCYICFKTVTSYCNEYTTMIKQPQKDYVCQPPAFQIPRMGNFRFQHGRNFVCSVFIYNTLVINSFFMQYYFLNLCA